MATDKPTTFNIENLNTIAGRLRDHADSIENIAAHQMELDLRLAAGVCGKLAGLRFRVAEIAEQLTDLLPAVARDLRNALAEAEGGQP